MLQPTPVFDTYWKFAAARHSVYLARLNGGKPPWTVDHILREYRFTNVYRAADRVSQFLIREIIYAGDAPADPEDMVFRVLLFKLFNRISTWRRLQQSLGRISWRTFDFRRYGRALRTAAQEGPVYSAAYVMPPPQLGEPGKPLNHLRLLELMMRNGLPKLVASAQSLKELYVGLRQYPSLGPFLAFQFTIDLNYTPLMTAGENDFVVPGPGALDGIRKCFGSDSRGIEPQIIRYMVEYQDYHFERLGLRFEGLFGRALHLIDCQNLFCEVDKYARVAHPAVRGRSRRSRIKQRFRPNREALPAFFPPKWGLAPGMFPAPAESPQLGLWSSTS